MTMTNIYDLYETDQSKETEGIWHMVSDKIGFLLARSGGANVKYNKAMEAKTRPYRRQIANDTMDTELANKLMREAFAETVVLDWKGVTDKNGKSVKYNQKTAAKLLTDLPDLFNDLREAASKHSNFRAEEIKEDLGN